MPSSPPFSSQVFPHRRKGPTDQWKLLKKAWSLKRNERFKLSKKKVEEATKEIYPLDPLEDLPDWIFRFCLFAGGKKYDRIWRQCVDVIEPLINSGQLTEFSTYYRQFRLEREEAYFDIIRTFFLSYSEFEQVWLYVISDVDISDDSNTGSAAFDDVRFFYGIAFEMLSSHVDILAMINNILCGRKFDTFQSMSLQKYLKLDKSSRFNPFSLNSEFTRLTEEKDNSLRNASHHNGMTFDKATQVIRYRAGKGGQGAETHLSYHEYLVKCCRIFIQILKLLQFEIMIFQLLGDRRIGDL